MAWWNPFSWFDSSTPTPAPTPAPTSTNGIRDYVPQANLIPNATATGDQTLGNPTVQDVNFTNPTTTFKAPGFSPTLIATTTAPPVIRPISVPISPSYLPSNTGYNQAAPASISSAAPVSGASGGQGTTSPVNLSTQTANQFGTGGSSFSGTVSGTAGLSGAAVPVTGRSSAGTVGYNASTGVDVYNNGSQDEQKKKTVASLQGLLDTLQGQLRNQIAVNPESFNPSTTPSAIQMKAATEATSNLTNLLSNPAYKLTAQQANDAFQSYYTKSYDQFLKDNPIPETPVVPTPEQNAAEQQNPDLKTAMDQFRTQVGLPGLEKGRLDLIAKLNSANDAYNAIVNDINNNPEIPKSLAQRRIEEFTKQNNVAIKSLMGQLDYTNQQITDANDQLNRNFQIYTAQKTEEDRRLDNNRSLLSAAISTGALGNFTPDQINQWAQLTGMDAKSLSQLSDAVRAKAEAASSGNAEKIANANERLSIAAENLKLAQQRLELQTTKANRLPAKQIQNLADFDTANSSWENIKKLQGTVQAALGRTSISNYKGTLADIFAQYGNNPQVATLKAEVEKAFQLYRKATTGAQASDKELAALRPNLPALTDTPAVFFGKIDQTIAGTDRAKSALLDNFDKAGYDTTQYYQGQLGGGGSANDPLGIR